MSRLLFVTSLFGIVCAAWSAEICCPDIGCFNDDPPFDNMPLPTCVNDQDPPPDYTMFTRSNRISGELFTHTTVPSIFNPSVRTVFMAHGWNSNGNSGWLTEMKNDFLDREDMNAVIVDWGGGAQLANYLQAASNTRTVGAYTALIIDNLIASGGGSNTLMWCTGHSLGAHVCGHCGMTTTLERVTGMDPAGPDFEGNPDLTVGLNPTSARFVDVIHTDTTYGTARTLGHIDFYPNSGFDQPGCVGSSCSHSRAHDLMIESIKADCFGSTSTCTDFSNTPGSCSSCTCGGSPCAYMGYAADYGCQQTGIFYLTTSAIPPYCQ